MSDKFSTKYFQIFGLKTMAFPRSLRCFVILNVIRVIILLDSFHFIYLFFSDRQIGNTTCTDEDQDGKREKKKTRFPKFAMCALRKIQHV